jgi:hypothetical protein
VKQLGQLHRHSTYQITQLPLQLLLFGSVEGIRVSIIGGMGKSGNQPVELPEEWKMELQQLAADQPEKGMATLFEQLASFLEALDVVSLKIQQHLGSSVLAPL